MARDSCGGHGGQGSSLPSDRQWGPGLLHKPFSKECNDYFGSIRQILLSETIAKSNVHYELSRTQHKSLAITRYSTENPSQTSPLSGVARESQKSLARRVAPRLYVTVCLVKLAIAIL